MPINSEYDETLMPLPKGDGTIFIPKEELKNGERCKKCHILINKEDNGLCYFCATNQ